MLVLWLSVFLCPALWPNLGLLATHSQSQQSHGASKHSTGMKNRKRGPMAPQLYFWDQSAEVQCGEGARKRGALMASWCELQMAQASLGEVCHCLDKSVELSNPLTQQFHFWVTQQTTHMATLDTRQAPRPIHQVVFKWVLPITNRYFKNEFYTSCEYKMVFLSRFFGTNSFNERCIFSQFL